MHQPVHFRFFFNPPTAHRYIWQRLTFLLCLFLQFFSAAPAAEALDGSAASGEVIDLGSPGNRYVSAVAITDVDSFQSPVDERLPAARIGVLFKIEPGWHIYWKNSGDSAIATRINWHLPPGWSAGDLQWPVPLKFYERSNLRTYGYSDEVLLFSNLYAPSVIPPADQPIGITADISWLVCKDICVPGKLSVELNRTFEFERPLIPSEQLEIFEKYAALVPYLVQNPNESTAWIENGSVSVTTPRLFQTAGGEQLISLFIAPNTAGRSISPQTVQIFPSSHESGTYGEPTMFGPAALEAKGQVYEVRVPYRPAASALKNPAPPGIVLSVGAGPSDRGLRLEWTKPLPAEISSVTAALGPELGVLNFRTEKKEAQPGMAAANAAVAPASQQPGGLFQALLLAFFGGLILNLMPCVLPIISIKVLGFVQKCHGSRRDAALSAGFFSLGIFSTMALLAGLVVLFRSVGMQVGWGFQFQFPGFVAFLALIIFILALGFFEVYQFALPCQLATRWEKLVNHPALKNIGDGILTVLLSTPCTAPFLGTALAFGFSQPPLIIFLVFLAIGSGLSLPYVVFSLSPALMRLLPKPGEWMHSFRQLMGFLMLLTVIWLLTVLDHLTEDGVRVILILMLGIFFLFWIRKQTIQSGLHARSSLAINSALFLSFFGAVYISHNSLTRLRAFAPAISSDLIRWEPYSAKLIQTAAEENVSVFIDFTAAWCITCKANERLVIETEKVARAITGLGIRPVKADWTAGDPEITAALEKYGASGVPLYVVVPKDGAKPIVLPSLLTTDLLLGAFKSAQSS